MHALFEIYSYHFSCVGYMCGHVDVIQKSAAYSSKLCGLKCRGNV